MQSELVFIGIVTSVANILELWMSPNPNLYPQQTEEEGEKVTAREYW